MSLLTIVQEAAKQLKIPTVWSVFGSTNEDAIQLASLANLEGSILSRRFDWQALVVETAITTTATEIQSGAIPSDFGRLVEESIFNRTTRKAIIGPLTGPEWQRAKMWGTGPVTPVYRIRGGDLLLIPTPPAGESVYFEYITTKWALSSGGTPKVAFSADDDTCRMPEVLIQLGIIWRWLERQGLAFETQAQIYEDAVGRYEQDDGGRRTVDMAGCGDAMPGYPLTPEGSWPI